MEDDVFEVENIGVMPEEKNLENAKKRTVKIEEAKEEKKEAKEENPNNVSLFFPLALGANIAIMNELHISPPNREEILNLHITTLELERKYGADKISTPETRFAAAFVMPIVRQFDLIIERFNELRKPKANNTAGADASKFESAT